MITLSFKIFVSPFSLILCRHLFSSSSLLSLPLSFSIVTYSPLIFYYHLFDHFMSSHLLLLSSIITSFSLTLYSHLFSLRTGFDIDLTLNFMFKQSHTDVNILKDIKTTTEGRSNVLHNATVVAHGYMNAGAYLRNVITFLLSFPFLSSSFVVLPFLYLLFSLPFFFLHPLFFTFLSSHVYQFSYHHRILLIFLLFSFFFLSPVFFFFFFFIFLSRYHPRYFSERES